jgi:hypothetical protein
MIDTINLQIERFEISEKYLSNFRQIKSDTALKYVFNPDPALGDYLPKITIKKIKGFNGLYTEATDIEFAIPKLLNNTNYFGIDENDKNQLINTLFDKLSLIFKGSPITKELIEISNIKNIAFAFNFILSENYGYPVEFLKVIPFLDIGKNYHKTKDTYYTESDRIGFCGRIYNKQVGWKMYDKGAEVIANAHNRTEKQIAIKLQHGQLPDKIIRMEITYQNRFTLKRHLATRLGGDSKQERQLKDVFSNKLCQEILLECFDKITNELNIKAMDTPLLPIHEYFRRTKQANMPLSDAYTWLGKCLATQQAGSYQLKLISDEFYSRQDRARADKKIQKLIDNYSLPSFTLKQVFDDCRKQLLEFKIMRLEHFIEKELANF